MTKDAVCADDEGKEELGEEIDKEEAGVEAESKEEVQGCVEEELDVVDLKRVRKGSVTEELAEEQKKDKTLLQCRSLAERWEKGFSWDNDLLFKIDMDDIRGELKIIVVPQTKRKELINRAHEKSGHLGSKKVLAMVTK